MGKQSHKPSPKSPYRMVNRWYGYHSQSWVVYDFTFYPLHEIQDGFDVGWVQHVSTILRLHLNKRSMSITHDWSMVLLYMVCHGSHQYTPFMLAYIPAPWILWVIVCPQWLSYAYSKGAGAENNSSNIGVVVQDHQMSFSMPSTLRRDFHRHRCEKPGAFVWHFEAEVVEVFEEVAWIALDRFWMPLKWCMWRRARSGYTWNGIKESWNWLSCEVKGWKYFVWEMTYVTGHRV